MGNQLSDEEIKKIANRYLDFFRPIISKISDEKLPKRLNKNELKDFGNSLKWFIQMGQIKSQIDSQTLPIDFKSKQQMQFLDNVIGGILGISTENPTKIMIDQGDPKILYVSLLNSETKAQEFQKNIHDIYYEIGKLGRIPQFEEFQRSVGIDTFISHTQSAERFNKHIKYLLRDRKRFSKRIVERYVNIFKEASGHLETLIIVLYGMNLIIQNKYKPFKNIRNRYSIGSMVGELKKLDLFSPLINIYNPHIRNSIQHTTYQLDAPEKKIEFTDRKYTKIMNFSDFVIHVQEIGKLAIMLSNIEDELIHLKFVEYQKYRKTLFKN